MLGLQLKVTIRSTTVHLKKQCIPYVHATRLEKAIATQAPYSSSDPVNISNERSCAL